MGLTKPKFVGNGVSLPVLSNPATAENIETGFEAINGLGAVISGSLEKVELISGTITLESHTISSVTIPELIGKNNFALFCITPSSVSITTSAKTFGILYRDGEVFATSYSAISSSTPNITFDNTTGEITSSSNLLGTDGTVNCIFGYVGW